MNKPISPPKIVLGVTVDQSLVLLRGFPQRLISEGWEVHLVSSDGPGMEEFERIEGLRLHRISMEREPSPLKDLSSLLMWIRMIRKVRPDVVSLGTPKASLLGLIASAVNRVPRRTYLLRGLRLEGETGIKAAILRTIEKITVAFSTDVLTVSDSLRDAALRLRIVEPSKITVLGAGSSNGVNVSKFRPNAISENAKKQFAFELGLSQAIPTIGFVGRLTLDKGLEYLIGASKLLSDRGYLHQLLVVGNIDDSAIDDSVMSYLKNSRHIVVTGRVNDSQPYYQIMDVLALPTRREGLPTVALEAQSSGVPVVTTAVTGAIDSVIKDTTGVLVPFGDSKALANALEALLTDRETHSKMSLRARTFVSENFAQEHVWNLLLKYYALGHGVRDYRA